MVKVLLLGYTIGVTVFLLFPGWIAIASVLAMDDATWRTWAELIRTLASGWLFFVAPALVLYALVILLPQILTNAMHSKELARQQAALRARARALNPQREPDAAGGQPAMAYSDASHIVQEGSALSANPSNAACEAERPDAACEAERPNAAGGVNRPDATHEAEAYGTEAAAEYEPCFPLQQRLYHYLLDTEPVQSSTLYRLIASLLIVPLLACVFFFVAQLGAELGIGQSEHFFNGLVATLLFSAYVAFLPMLAYWLVSELLLRLRPLWLASRLRHTASGALLGTLIILCTRWLDPAFSEFPLSPLSLLQTLLLGAGSGALLATLYRIPIQWNLNTD